MLMSSYTWSRFREQVDAAQSVGGPESRVGAVDRPHRITLASVAELPFGRDSNGAATGIASSKSILGGWQFSTKYEWQPGMPLVFNRTPTLIRRAAIPGVQLAVGQQRQRPATAWTCRFSTPLLLHAEQPAVQERGGPGGHVPRPRRSASARRTSAPSRRRCRTCGSGSSPARSRVDQEHPRRRSRARAGADRGAQRRELHLFGLGNLATTSNNATFRRLSNIDSSTVMKPRDVQLGVRVTF